MKTDFKTMISLPSPSRSSSSQSETAAIEKNPFALPLSRVQTQRTSTSSASIANKPNSSASSLTTDKSHSTNDVDDDERSSSMAWTVIGSSLAVLCSFGHQVTFGTYQHYYATHHLADRSAGDISWIGSSQLGVLFAFGLPVGMLHDRYGPRPLGALGSFLLTGSLVGASFADNYWQLLLTHGLLFGIGSSFMFFPFLATLSLRCRNSPIIGFVMAATNIGGMIFPPLLDYILPRLGYPTTMRIMAGLTAACCMIAVICIERERCSPTAPLSSMPFTPVVFLKQDAPYITLTLGSCFVALGLFTPFIYIVQYTSYLDTQTGAFVTLSLMNLGGILGRLAPYILSKVSSRRVSSFWILTGSTLLSAISCLALWLPSQAFSPLIYAFVLGYGVFSGVFIAILVPCIAETTRHPSWIGRRMGGLYSVVSIPTILSAPTAGLILQHAGAHSGYGERTAASFDWTIAFTALTMFLGTAIFILGIVYVCKRQDAASQDLRSQESGAVALTRNRNNMNTASTSGVSVV